MERSQSETIKNQDQLIERMVTKKNLGWWNRKMHERGWITLLCAVKCFTAASACFWDGFTSIKNARQKHQKSQGRTISEKKHNYFPMIFYLRWNALNKKLLCSRASAIKISSKICVNSNGWRGEQLTSSTIRIALHISSKKIFSLIKSSLQ